MKRQKNKFGLDLRTAGLYFRKFIICIDKTREFEIHTTAHFTSV